MTEAEKIELLPVPVKTTVKTFYPFRPADLPENPQKNVWYTYRPAGCVCSDGEPYYSTLKIGTENKLLIMFCGGGVALDAYSAARPNTYIPEEGKPTFYVPNTFIMGYFTGRGGIARSERADNPFKNWSVVVVSYGSGDFHCGNNDFEYQDEEFGNGVCRHRGYKNYRSMVEKMRKFVPNPDKVLVTGYSAGGFGTALLTDDIIGLFDKCNDFTCFPDSSIIEYKGWHDTASKQWGAPKEICDKLKGDNLTVDCLVDLKRKHRNRVKIAFGCTYRDALLAQAQNYADRRPFIFDKEGGDRFQSILKKSMETLIKEIPDIALYIFDKPHPEVKIDYLTEHCFVAADFVFDYSYSGVKAIDWIVSAVNGNPQKVGLKLLDIKI